MSTMGAGLLLGGAALVALTAVFFARGQNSEGRIGGGISRPKQLWLGYAIYSWFVLPPVLSLETTGLLRCAFTGLWISMWLRGAAEMFMMYVTKNWRPPYGIAHNLLSAAWVAGCLGYGLYAGFELPAGLSETVATWAVAYLGVLLATLLLETYYAWAFLGLVGTGTQGHDAVWFASKRDPKFQRINRITTVANVPLFLFAAAFLFIVGFP